MLDRDAELTALDAALDDALAGNGSLTLVEGPAGIGKTALLNAARDRAEQRGMLVLPGRGAELEAGFPYGVVRQLFERLIRAASDEQRERTLGGGAAASRPAILGPESPAATAPDQPFAVVHGLYWLVANLAAEQPLALLLDDVHWADSPSLRFLAHLAPRLDGLAAAALASVRTGEDGSDSELVQSLRSAPRARSLRLEPLSEDGVGRLLSAEFRTSVDPDFARACRAMTAGNPFYLHELSTSLRGDGIAPTHEEAERVSRAAPASIAQLTLTRLGRLGDRAIGLARAIAVLDADATLPRAAALAGLDPDQALVGLDALLGIELVSTEPQLAFLHPIVRTAIYDEFAPGARSATHRNAAELLRGEGASLDTVAAHMVASEPVGSPETVELLRSAANKALAVGAPESAATYLLRALEEGPEREIRAALLVELGQIGLMAGQPTAQSHFEEASQLTADPVIRVRAALHQSEVAWFTGDLDAMLSQLDFARTHGDPSLQIEIEALHAGMTGNDPRLVDEFDRRAAARQRLLADGGTRSRTLALVLACIAACRGESSDGVRELVALGWDDGRYLADGESAAILPQGLGALLVVDQLDAADALIAEVLGAARQRGSALYHVIGTAHQARSHILRGDLTAAAAEARNGLELGLELKLQNAVVAFIYYCDEVWCERPDLADLASLIETVELGPLSEVASGALVLGARARLRFAAGRSAEAIDDMRRAGAICQAVHFTNLMGLATWRSTLALMLGPAARDEALALAQAELSDARDSGQPRRIGIALRALGQLQEDRDAGTQLIEEAVGVLEDSPARLEHARAIVALGASFRRVGERRQARELLREGLDQLTVCGALRSAELARDELAATGARPRRERITGRDALTPSELRVARLAAEGCTSREIAQALFITTKTVDAHLAHTYTKLGINSRKQLPEALAVAQATDSPKDR